MFQRFLRTSLLLVGLAAPAVSQGNTLSFQDLGGGCGPTLSGSFTQLGQGNGLRLSATITTLAPSATVAVFVGGPSVLPNPFPFDIILGQNFGCTLGVDVIFAQQHQARDNSYVWSRSLGSWFGTATLQFAEMNVNGNLLEVRTTNILEVTRPAS